MAAIEIGTDWLADHPIPVPGDESTKRDRGTVVVAGATAETPGALLLAGLAALRAGAGRLQVLAPQPVAVALGVAIPEAQVTGVEIDGSGTLAPDDRLRAAFSAADVILVGPGLGGDVDAAPLVAEALAASDAVGARVVADAGAVAALATSDRRRAGVAERLVATPNVAEARALHKGRDAQREPEAVTRALAEELGCVVAVRGSTTWIAVPGEPLLVERGGVPGLATSGSGDVLAGLVAGLLARGARPLDAAAWAIHVHAAAGAHLAGPASGTGLLARELLDCIQPMLVARSEAPSGR